MCTTVPRNRSNRLLQFLRRHPLALVLAVPLILIVADLARRDNAPRTIGPVVEIDPARLDFGAVWSTDDFVWEAPIRNVSGETLDVRLATSCGCTSIEPREFALSPQEERMLTIHLDLRSPTGTRRTGPHERPFTVDLNVYSQNPRSPTELPQRDRFALGGHVRDAVHIAAKVIQYGGAERLIEGSVAQPRTVSAFGLTPLSDLRAGSDTADFATHVERSGDTEDEWLLTVTPTEFVPIGEFVGEIRLHPVSAAGEELPSIPLKVQGTKETEFVLSPSRIQFVAQPGLPTDDPPVEAGLSAQETVTLSSRSGRPFLVVVEGLNGDDVIDGQALRIEPPASDTALRHEFTLKPVPSSETSATREVTFSIYSDDRDWTLILPVFVHAAAGAPSPEVTARR